MCHRTKPQQEQAKPTSDAAVYVEEGFFAGEWQDPNTKGPPYEGPLPTIEDRFLAPMRRKSN